MPLSDLFDFAINLLVHTVSLPNHRLYTTIRELTTIYQYLYGFL